MGACLPGATCLVIVKGCFLEVCGSAGRTSQPPTQCQVVARRELSLVLHRIKAE